MELSSAKLPYKKKIYQPTSIISHPDQHCSHSFVILTSIFEYSIKY